MIIKTNSSERARYDNKIVLVRLNYTSVLVEWESRTESFSHQIFTFTHGAIHIAPIFCYAHILLFGWYVVILKRREICFKIRRTICSYYHFPVASEWFAVLVVVAKESVYFHYG